MHEVLGTVLSVLNILTHLIITTNICILGQGNQTEQTESLAGVPQRDLVEN